MARGVTSRRRGSAVLIALAVLGALSCMAISFCVLMRVESAASTNHLLATRARLLAEAGVRRAVAELGASELDDPTGLEGGWLVSDPGVPIERAKNLSWGS